MSRLKRLVGNLEEEVKTCNRFCKNPISSLRYRHLNRSLTIYHESRHHWKKRVRGWLMAFVVLGLIFNGLMYSATAGMWLSLLIDHITGQ